MVGSEGVTRSDRVGPLSCFQDSRTRQEAPAQKEHFNGKTTEEISVESQKYPAMRL